MHGLDKDQSGEWMTKLGWLRCRFRNRGSCGKKGSKGKSRSIEAKFLRRHFFATFPSTGRRFSESWWWWRRWLCWGGWKYNINVGQKDAGWVQIIIKVEKDRRGGQQNQYCHHHGHGHSQGHGHGDQSSSLFPLTSSSASWWWRVEKKIGAEVSRIGSLRIGSKLRENQKKSASHVAACVHRANQWWWWWLWWWWSWWSGWSWWWWW